MIEIAAIVAMILCAVVLGFVGGLWRERRRDAEVRNRRWVEQQDLLCRFGRLRAALGSIKAAVVQAEREAG